MRFFITILTIVCISFSLNVSKGYALITCLPLKGCTVVSAPIFINGNKHSEEGILENNTTLVPLRGIFEALGAEVKWDQKNKTIDATKGNTKVWLKIGSKTTKVNGKTITISVPAKVIKDHTFVPLRFVSESLGEKVQWDDSLKTVFIGEKPSDEELSSGPLDQVTGDVPIKKAKKTKIMDEYNFLVYYGDHHYGIPWFDEIDIATDQLQYDKVMESVFKALETGYNKTTIGGENEKYYMEFLDGARWDGDRSNRTERNMGLAQAQSALGDYVSYGFSKAEIIKLVKTLNIAKELISSTTEDNWSGSSAYDLLVKGISNDSSRANAFQATFDAMGYNTMYLAKRGGGSIAVVEVKNTWHYYNGFSFKQIKDLRNFVLEGGYISSPPTYGGKPW